MKLFHKLQSGVVFISILVASAVSAEMTAEIRQDGQAKFTHSSSDNQVSWIVTCTQPMRDCSARSASALVRVSGSKVRLAVMSSNDHWMMTSTGVNWLGWPDSKLQMLSKGDVAYLSQSEIEIYLIGAFGQQESISLSGLSEVAGYLMWLQTDTARALRDARLWPRGNEVNTADLSDQARHRYEELLRRRARVSFQSTSLAPMIALGSRDQL